MALYHRDIGFPARIPWPVAGLVLTPTVHALRAAREEGLDWGKVDIPWLLPARFTVVEAEVIDGQISKYVVRFPLPARPGQDIVMAITPEGRVKTVWLNHCTDTHHTLDRSRYTRPQETV